jgi:hypothetical protein
VVVCLVVVRGSPRELDVPVQPDGRIIAVSELIDGTSN